MALFVSNDLANAMLNALETLIGTSALFQIWSGAIPADETATPAGTKLVEISCPSDYLAAASSGVITKSGTWSVAAIATGTGAFWRLCTSAGVSKLQGSLTATGGGGDATIDNLSIAAAQVITVVTFQITFPHL